MQLVRGQECMLKIASIKLISTLTKAFHFIEKFHTNTKLIMKKEGYNYSLDL